MSSLPLLPDSGPRLVGIARLASHGESLRRGHEIEYFALPVKSLLNRCTSARMPFAWTINPYRGCEFACKYCHAYEKADSTACDHIKRTSGPVRDWDELTAQVQSLKKSLFLDGAAPVRAAMKHLVPEYHLPIELTPEPVHGPTWTAAAMASD